MAIVVKLQQRIYFSCPSQVVKLGSIQDLRRCISEAQLCLLSLYLVLGTGSSTLVKEGRSDGEEEEPVLV